MGRGHTHPYMDGPRPGRPRHSLTWTAHLDAPSEVTHATCLEGGASTGGGKARRGGPGPLCSLTQVSSASFLGTSCCLLRHEEYQAGDTSYVTRWVGGARKSITHLRDRSDYHFFMMTAICPSVHMGRRPPYTSHWDTRLHTLYSRGWGPWVTQSCCLPGRQEDGRIVYVSRTSFMQTTCRRCLI